MPRDVTRQIDAMRLRLQGRQILTATCWLVATVLFGAFILACIDRLLSVGDLAGRIVFTVLLFSMIVLAGGRWLREVWKRRFTSVTVAQRIEHQHPELRDIVTSALFFNRQPSSEIGAGSVSLRRAVVIRAAENIHTIDWRQLVSPRGIRQATLFATIAMLVVALLMWRTPTLLNVGVSRLLNPFSVAEWPRVNDLQFLDPPSILSAGDDLLLTLCDTRGVLPATVTLQTRVNRKGRKKISSQTFATTGSSYEIRLPNIQKSLEYRAIGGDHTTMHWQTLEVVTPPKITTFQVTVQPPTYTQLPEYQFETGKSLLAGSHLQVKGRLDRQATSLTLQGQAGLILHTVLDDQGKTFHTQAKEWRIESSDIIAFAITTVDGLQLRSRQQLALNVSADRVPRVTFVEPTGKLLVTPSAVVSVVVDVYDDLAIHNVQLTFSRADSIESDSQRVTIYQGPAQALPPPAGVHQQASHSWHLDALGLSAGNALEVHAEASDYRPGVGKTITPLRLVVVTEEELLNDIAETESGLLKKLQQLYRQQNKLREQTIMLATQTDLGERQVVEKIGRMLSRHRLMTDTITNDRGGLIQQLEKIIVDFDRNGLYRPENKKRLRSLQQLLVTLVQQPLPAIEQLLSDSLRMVQSTQAQTDSNRQQEQRIASVTKRQDEVLEILQKAIDLLSLENTLARYENEVALLQSSQEQLANQSREAKSAIASKATDRNKQGKWQQATHEQRKISRDLAKLVQRMSRSAKRQLTIAGQLSEAVSLSQELGIQATMQKASDHLGKQQFSQTQSLQLQAIAGLQEMRNRLTGNQVGNDQNEASTQEGTEGQSDGNAVAGSSPKESVEPPGSKQVVSTAGNQIPEDLVKDLWGHLPERQREQILQPLREEFLPKYAPEIEAYYRSLAEPSEVSER